ncbi:hypothetical protein TcWFU_007513 [Taenia crassiceps]|uniref:Uncharacterized protein n=1 Tax=Taenia crassiceps TaxID=6207 RepID=A0ABR4QSG3_9CEST
MVRPLAKLGIKRKSDARANTRPLKQFEDPLVNEIVSKLINQSEEPGTGGQKLRKVPDSNGNSFGGSLKLGSDYKHRQPFHDPPADVLKLHASLFTEPKDFRPSTLKSSASSRIRELSCYNPPRRRRMPEHLKEFDLSRVPPQSGNGNLEVPSRDALTGEVKGRPQKPSSFNKYHPRDPDLSSKPVLRSPTPPSVYTSSRKVDSARSGAGWCTQKKLEDIEYVTFLSAVTNDILTNRQFSDRNNG